MYWFTTNSDTLKKLKDIPKALKILLLDKIIKAG